VPNPAMPTSGVEQLVFADAEVLRVQTQSNPPIVTVPSTPAREQALATAENNRLRFLLEVRRHEPNATAAPTETATPASD